MSEGTASLSLCVIASGKTVAGRMNKNGFFFLVFLFPFSLSRGCPETLEREIQNKGSVHNAIRARGEGRSSNQKKAKKKANESMPPYPRVNVILKKTVVDTDTSD